MTAAFVVIACFIGISGVIATVAICILIGDNRLTLPHTNARRIARAQADLVVSEIMVKREQAELFREDLIEKRMRKALGRGE